MKRCIRCNYRARTEIRLRFTGSFNKNQYECRPEYKKECDAKAKRVREKNNQGAA